MLLALFEPTSLTAVLKHVTHASNQIRSSLVTFVVRPHFNLLREMPYRFVAHP
jgi:hypothetical protein